MSSNRKPLILPLLALLLGAAACGRKASPEAASAPQADATATSATAALGSYYTCSMHPQVHQDHPGDCPICGMALIKVSKPTAGANSRTLQLSAEQMRLGNIKLVTVGGDREMPATGQLAPSAGLRLTGRVVLDPRRLVQISARVPGRIDRLYVRATGETVRAGAPLFAVYSEELLKAQQELLLAHAQRRALAGNGLDYTPLEEAARTKLRLWGMTAGQLTTLIRTGKVFNPMPYYSPQTGVVQELTIREGDYVSEGAPVLELADLGSVWVEAQLFANDQPMLYGQPVQVSFPAFPGRTVRGRVSFISPELAGDSKVTLVRVQIPNPDQRYTPGLQAIIEPLSFSPEPKVATGALQVPVEAVLQESAGNSMWVRNADGSFENRMVRLGAQTGEQIEVLSNLKAGEQVVVNGAYLLNSEYILQKGTTPMAGMEEMKGMKM